MMVDGEDELLFCNGIDGATGAYGVDPPPTIAQVAAIARGELTVPGVPAPGSSTRSPFDSAFAPVLAELSEMGWGVIFAKGTPPDVRAALRPLIDLRREQAADLFKEFDFDPAADSFRTWLGRHGLSPGNLDWERIPFYLLIVGDPSAIPFEFQYLLDIEYAVGRITFDTPAEYDAYARSVVAYERAEGRIQQQELVLWGTRHDGDSATVLSADLLLAPLAAEGTPAEGSRDGRRSGKRSRAATYRTTATVGTGGTKANLLGVLHRGAEDCPPAMLFTASHGVCWPVGDPRQQTLQGALLSQEWGYGSPVESTDCVAAADIGDHARLHGLVAFLFGCFTAGTPEKDGFGMPERRRTALLASKPFVSPLPRRLLAHPGGGALAVIGHVDRAWGYSIRSPTATQKQIEPFRTCIRTVLSGWPIGLATSDFSRRYATLSAHLLGFVDDLRSARPGEPVELFDRQLVGAFLERNDAQSYVLLGDPAARFRPELAPR
jgi:hypothetical protein